MKMVMMLFPLKHSGWKDNGYLCKRMFAQRGRRLLGIPPPFRSHHHETRTLCKAGLDPIRQISILLQSTDYHTNIIATYTFPSSKQRFCLLLFQHNWRPRMHCSRLLHKRCANKNYQRLKFNLSVDLANNQFLAFTSPCRVASMADKQN